MKNQFNTPILLLTFNRPETTEKVFEEVKKIRPKELFVEVNGPRENHPEDIEKVKQVIKIIKNIDWPCKLKTLIREKNIGCKRGVSGGISWFFENVEEGIILEDDCVPTKDFFMFCSELLNKYRDDERIMHIAGYSFQRSKPRTKDSYYFSNYPYEWGWATWRRAWKKYNLAMSNYPELINDGFLRDVFPNKIERLYVKRIMDLSYFNNRDVWDTQWMYSVITNGGFCIIPNKNLVSNIGFNKNATHHTSKIDSYLDLPVEKIEFPLKHPPFVIKDRVSDRRYAFWLFRNFIRKNLLLKTGLFRFFS